MLKLEKKSNLVNLILVGVLVVIIITTGIYIRDSFLNVIFYSDDPQNINAANIFRESGDIGYNFTPTITAKSFALMGEAYYEFPIHDVGKGPFYFIILGSFFQILDTEPKDLLFHATIFSNILSIIFIIIFFFLIKRKFSVETAFFSGLLIILSTLFVRMSYHVTPVMLLYILAISALFFLDKKTIHYILFGVFAGLAHITHPFGIMLGISYSIFLLVNKEVRGFLLIISTWFLILLPVFTRNYAIFGDIGAGLYIPFSKKISLLFSFIPTKENLEYSHSGIPDIIPQPLEHHTIFEIIQIMITRFSVDQHMYFLIVFVIIFAGFAYFTINKTNNFSKHKLMILLGFISFYGLGMYFANYSENNAIQFFVLFILPILILFLFRRCVTKSIFEQNLPRLYKFIILFSFLSLLFSLGFAILENTVDVDIRIVLFGLYLLVPVSIFGFIKIRYRILRNFKKINPKLLGIIILIVALTPIVIQDVDSIKSIPFNFENVENLDIQSTNEYIRNNLPPDISVGSNQPFITSLKTNLQTVVIPLETIETKFENYITHYDLSYLIFYDLPSYQKMVPKSFTDFTLDTLNWDNRNYFYYDVYSTQTTHILKIASVSEADITNPAYVWKGYRLQKTGNIEEAEKIFEEIRSYDFETKDLGDLVCKRLILAERFEDASYKCQEVAEKYQSTGSIENLMIATVEIGTHDDLLLVLQKYFNIFYSSLDNLAASEALWSLTNSFSYAITHSPNFDLSTILKVKGIEKIGSYDSVLTLKEELKSADLFPAGSIEYKVRVFEILFGQNPNLDKIDDKLIQKYKNNIIIHEKIAQENVNNFEIQKSLINALILQFNILERKNQDLIQQEVYEETFPVFDDLEIILIKTEKIYRENGAHSEANEIQKSLIKNLLQKGRVLIKMGEVNDAEKVFTKIITINKFVKEPWKEMAILLENKGELKQAIVNYEFYLKLAGIHTDDHFEELKQKLQLNDLQN